VDASVLMVKVGEFVLRVPKCLQQSFNRASWHLCRMKDETRREIDLWVRLGHDRPCPVRPTQRILPRWLYIAEGARNSVNGKGCLSIAGLTLVALLLASSAVASQQVGGFVTYQLSLTSPSGQHSVLVTETVGPTSKAGYSDLILQLFGKQQNLSYSRFVNASDVHFPYLPTIATRSFEYTNGTKYSVHVNLTSSGTTMVTFKGSQYSLSVLSISISGSYGPRTYRANGTVDTFPSSLVYSASLGNGTAKVEAVLQATDLPLNQSSPQSSTAAYVGAGVGIGALALGGAFLIRRRTKKVESKGEKPMHWVD
jgi:hypothetical protein